MIKITYRKETGKMMARKNKDKKMGRQIEREEQKYEEKKKTE